MCIAEFYQLAGFKVTGRVPQKNQEEDFNVKAARFLTWNQ